MRPTPKEKVENGRLKTGYYASSLADACNGAFMVMGPTGAELAIMASDGVDPEAQGWEHVSVSTKHRCPNWDEMCFVKDAFWEDEECVLQFHPPRSKYISIHPYCLHLWRRRGLDPVLPPSITLG